MKRTPLRRGEKPLKRMPMKRATTALRRNPIRRRPTVDGVTTDTRRAVDVRSGGACEVRTGPWCTGRGVHKHHRKLRRSQDHRAINLLNVCQPCHLWLHAHPASSYDAGLLVHEWDDPAVVPVVTRWHT